MLIVCPSCGVRYNVPASYLSKDRTLKCANCGTSWVVPALQQNTEETGTTVAAPAEPPAPPPPQVEAPVPPASSASGEPAHVTPHLPAPAPETPHETPRETSPDASESLIAEPAVAESVDSVRTVAGSSPASPTVEKPAVPPAADHAESASPAEISSHVAEQAASSAPSVDEPPASIASEPAFSHETPPSPFPVADVGKPVAEQAIRDDGGRPLDEQTPWPPKKDKTQARAEFSGTTVEDTPPRGGHEKPFSFLDLPGTIKIDEQSFVRSLRETAKEQAAQEKAAAEHAEVSGGSESGSETGSSNVQSEKRSRIWDEKELDSHFEPSSPQSHRLYAEEADHQESMSNHKDSGEGVGHQAGRASSPEEVPLPEPADGKFDDVIAKLRASRNAPSPSPTLETEPVEPAPAPVLAKDHTTEHSPADTWIPAWDRVASSEGAPEEQQESEPFSVWADYGEEEHAEAPAEGHDASEATAHAAEEPEKRHVTPQNDISSRLRNDVLERTAPGRHNSRKFGKILESPAFWKKAWIASGVCAVLGLAAFIHWFSAFRHIWPALNFL